MHVYNYNCWISCVVYFAAQEGRLKCLKWLIEYGGGDPHQTSNDGMNPLHAAAQSGRLEVAKWLISSESCKANSKTLDGGTAVHFAAAKGTYCALCIYPFHITIIFF